jgi:hypothetical protein
MNIFIYRLKIWLGSKSLFWKLRARLREISTSFEHNIYKRGASTAKVQTNARILGSFAWIGAKSLFWVILALAALNYAERYAISSLSWAPVLSDDEKKFNIDQLRLYAQLLTAIFSIYFATIGIILSAGYTRLRRDIIQMLTNEQVSSVYSRVLVLSAIFCLVATALPLFEGSLGLFVYAVGTTLTLLSVLALFPLGQRLFNFFDIIQLVRSEVLPSIARHIEGAANPRNSISLSNYHSKAARHSLEQLYYIDDRIKIDKEGLEDNLPTLSSDYMILLLHYLQQKHTIAQESYWFPRRSKHKQWFFAGDSATTMALQTSSQQMLIEEKPDQQWLENEIVGRLASHIELAFQIGDFNLALKLIGRLSTRISAYAQQFQFDVGMQEIKNIKVIIEQAFASQDSIRNEKTEQVNIGIADTWAALGSNLCLETLRRMMTFEKVLKLFFEEDKWSNTSLRNLPAFLQVELAFIIERIELEQEIEGQRLSKPKYVQQLAVQKLLQHYATVIPEVCSFYQKMVPDFVDSLIKLKMTKAATQVVLASLHSHWKLPGRFDELAQLVDHYHEYQHYTEKQYELPKIDFIEMSKQFVEARENAIAMLGKGALIGHIFESKHSDQLPDHFGQIYFELAEACINALEQNDQSKLNKVLPMFLALAFVAADEKFTDPSLDVNNEFRLHLISTVINDLASVLGFSILYGAYFNNEELSVSALAKFENWIARAPDKQQYLKRMVMLANSHSFSMSASPRGIIRTNWKMSFESRARYDGFEDRMRMTRGVLHPNKVVRKFLQSHSDAAHLFFATQVVPQFEDVDFKIDYQITDLARQLQEDSEEVEYENFQI